MADDNQDRRLEMTTAILLSAAGVATAWATYQSSLWDGEQAADYSLATARLTEASQLEIVAGQRAAVDTTLFIDWVDAAYRGDPDRQDFFEARFSAEFMAAFKEWRPRLPDDLTGFRPPAADRPIPVPKPVYPEREAAREARAQAHALFREGEAANAHGDRFVAVTVLLSAVLFLGGISQLLKSPGPRRVMLGLAAAIGVGALVWMAALPMAQL